MNRNQQKYWLETRTFIKTKVLSLSFLKTSYLIILAGILVMFYIFQVNITTLKGYKLRELQLQLGQLKNSHEELLVEEATLRSLVRIEQGISGLEMIDSKQLIHVDPIDTIFAQR